LLINSKNQGQPKSLYHKKNDKKSG